MGKELCETLVYIIYKKYKYIYVQGLTLKKIR